MMAKQTIRSARVEDAAALAEIKRRHVQALYRGFLSAEYLKGLAEGCFLEEVSGWLNGAWQVDVIRQDEAITGYAVYGADPEDKDCGLILEIGALPADGWSEQSLLIRSCLDKLAEKYELVHVHTVRDNFRVRFLYEQLGFRADGKQFTRMIDDSELRIIRLVGRAGSRE